MLQGYVDSVTHDTIEGWAADDDNPQEIMRVMIFINERKVGETRCELDRPDLLQLGTYGDGRHGFCYHLPQLTDQRTDRRICIRHADSGTILTKGHFVFRLGDGHIEYIPRNNWVEDGPAQLPIPHSPRSLFETFALYDPRSLLYDLLSRMQFAAEKPRHVHYAVFGQHKFVTPALTVDWADGQRARDYMYDLLLSPEFQRELIPLFLDAFPEKKRIIFVHIPKCAGTDLSVKLSKRFPTIHQTMTEESWTSKEHFFGRLSQIAIQVRVFDSIFVCGHNRLEYLISNNLLRAVDDVFTVLRDPVEAAISHVNYVLTRFKQDSEAHNLGPDTRGWLDLLGLEALPSDFSVAKVTQLSKEVLRSIALVTPNPMCFWLGGSNSEAIIQQLIEHEVEVTVTDEYDRWLFHRWKIHNTARTNRSEAFLSGSSLAPEDIGYIHEMTAEDAVLFSKITARIRRAKTPSVKGEALAGLT